MTHGKKRQAREDTLFDYDSRITHKKVWDKLSKEKNNFGKMPNIKGHHQNPNFGG